MVEQETLNLFVVGSNPTRVTRRNKTSVFASSDLLQLTSVSPLKISEEILEIFWREKDLKQIFDLVQQFLNEIGCFVPLGHMIFNFPNVIIQICQ